MIILSLAVYFTMDKVEMWTRHFQRMAEGKLKPDHKGHYVVEKIQTGGVSKEPTIQFVTPVAQAVELAKSEVARRKREDGESPRKVSRLYGPPGLRD